MDPVLLLVGQDASQAESTAGNDVHGQGLAELAQGALDLIGYFVPWAHAIGRRLILISDAETAALACASLIGVAPPRSVETRERTTAPILFLELLSPTGGAPSRAVEAGLGELHEFGLLDFAIEEESSGPSGLASLLRRHHPTLVIFITRDGDLWSAIENYRSEAGPNIQCFTVPASGFEFSGITVLRQDDEQFSTLPLLTSDSEELVREERAARKSAALIVDLLRRLNAPPAPETDSAPGMVR